MAAKLGKNKKNTLAVLDIGSHKTVCLIAHKDDKKAFTIIGQGHQYSEGVSHGSVIDLEAAEAAISATVDEAEQQAGEKIGSVIVNLSAGRPSTSIYSYPVQFSGGKILNADIASWIDPTSFQLDLAENKSLVQATPVRYRVDNEVVPNPKDLYGSKIEVDMLLTSALSAPIRNLEQALRRSRLHIANQVTSPMASSLACLTPEEMRIGAIVLDVGGGTISWAIWKDGYFAHGGEIPSGGLEITTAIAKAFSTSLENAERLKTLHGSVLSYDLGATEAIDVEQIAEEGGLAEFTRGDINQVVRRHLSRQLAEISLKLNSIQGASEIRRVVVTGGSSEFPGFSDFVGEKLGREGHVRLGRPYLPYQEKNIVNSPVWSTAVGLLHFATQDIYRPIESDLQAQYQAGLWGRMRHWFRLAF